MEVPPPVDEGMESNDEAAPATASTSTDIESFLGLQQEGLRAFFQPTGFNFTKTWTDVRVPD